MNEEERYSKIYLDLKISLLTVSSAIIGGIVAFGQNKGQSTYIKLSVLSLVFALLIGYIQVLTETNANRWESIFEGQKKLIDELN